MNTHIVCLLIFVVVAIASCGQSPVTEVAKELRLICEHEADKKTDDTEFRKHDKMYNAYLSKDTLEMIYFDKKTGKEDKKAAEESTRLYKKHYDLNLAYYNQCIKNGGK